ncbi:MAG: hypothetical protein ACT4QF_11065 [Sporichthyaceae bacterium]
MSKLRPVVLAVAACAMSAILIPLGAHPAGAETPPPNVQPPGVPFGLCSVVDQAASSQENKCQDAKGKYSDDDEDEPDKFDEREADEKSGFPFDDEDDD